MKKLALLLPATPFMASFVLTSSTSSTKGASVDEGWSLASNHQSTHSHQIAQTLLFDLLPLELKISVFSHVPLSSLLLVCQEWTKMIEKRCSSEKKIFYEKVGWFERLFKTKARYDAEIECLDMHFESERERNRVLSNVIASYSNEIIKLQQLKEQQYNHPALMERLIDMSMELFLEKTYLIAMLPKLSSPNPKGHLFNLLSGLDGFHRLPLKARQFIAAKLVWNDQKCEKSNIHSLSYFLVFYCKDFDKFKDSLVAVKCWIVAEACIRIILRIDHVESFSAKDQKRLLGLIKSLFPDDPLVVMACSLSKTLSSSSSISSIISTMENVNPSLCHIISRVIQHSSRLAFAKACMTALTQGHFEIGYDGPYHLLFDNEFLKNHDISSNQKFKLLSFCEPNDFFCKLFGGLTLDLANLNIQALIEWFNDNPHKKRTLLTQSLIALYSLDNDKNAFSKYSQILESKCKDLFALSQVVLGAGCAQHLTLHKQAALLKFLDPESLSDLVSCFLGGDRKRLVVKAASWLGGGYGHIKLVNLLSDSDLSLWIEACLDCPETRELPMAVSGSQKAELAARMLIKHIGDDVGKMSNLLKLPNYYRVKVFLLADCDKVADFLSENESFSGGNLMIHHPNAFLSWEEVARAAKRMYTHLSKRSQRHLI